MGARTQETPAMGKKPRDLAMREETCSIRREVSTMAKKLAYIERELRDQAVAM